MADDPKPQQPNEKTAKEVRIRETVRFTGTTKPDKTVTPLRECGDRVATG